MGWTYGYKPRNQSVADYLKAEFEGTNDSGQKWEVLDCAVVNLRTAYLAMRIPGDSVIASSVIGVICLLDYRPKDRYNFGYKDVDEGMGPYEDKCPARILNLLSPLPEAADGESLGITWAREWRARCTANLHQIPRSKIVVGSVIKLQGTRLDAYPARVTMVQGERIFAVVNGRQYRIPHRMIATIEGVSL